MNTTVGVGRLRFVAAIKTFVSGAVGAAAGIIFVFMMAEKPVDPVAAMTPVVQNIHNFIRRDIFLANEMTPDWEVIRAVEAQNDTLIIRFSIIDSVRYYQSGSGALWREDVKLLENVLEWRAQLLPDSTSYEVFISVGTAERPVHYEWIIIPRVGAR